MAHLGLASVIPPGCPIAWFPKLLLGVSMNMAASPGDTGMAVALAPDHLRAREDDANGSPANSIGSSSVTPSTTIVFLVKGAGFLLTARNQLSAHSLRPACTCSGPQSPSAENDCTVAAITVPKIPRTNTTMPATAAARPELSRR